MRLGVQQQLQRIEGALCFGIFSVHMHRGVFKLKCSLQHLPARVYTCTVSVSVLFACRPPTGATRSAPFAFTSRTIAPKVSMCAPAKSLRPRRPGQTSRPPFWCNLRRIAHIGEFVRTVPNGLCRKAAGTWDIDDCFQLAQRVIQISRLHKRHFLCLQYIPPSVRFMPGGTFFVAARQNSCRSLARFPLSEPWARSANLKTL